MGREFRNGSPAVDAPALGIEVEPELVARWLLDGDAAAGAAGATAGGRNDGPAGSADGERCSTEGHVDDERGRIAGDSQLEAGASGRGAEGEGSRGRDAELAGLEANGNGAYGCEVGDVDERGRPGAGVNHVHAAVGRQQQRLGAGRSCRAPAEDGGRLTGRDVGATAIG